MDDRLKAFQRLLDVMDELREKCPWDRKQTMESLRILTIEETYELADAILEGDEKGVEEEIGDLMLHMVFYAKIGSENGSFDIGTALNKICDKLVARHPHVYGDVVVNGEEEVKENWEKLKLKEGKPSILAGVPKSLPALVKAYRMQEKTAQVGFEWDKIQDVWAKVDEELNELKEAKKERREEEFGDLLFSLINLSRFLQIDPEASLERCNQKFKRRFNFIEKSATKMSKDLQLMSLEEMDSLWEEAKRRE